MKLPKWQVFCSVWQKPPVFCRPKRAKVENTKVSGVLLKVAKITAVLLTTKSKGENTKVSGVLLKVAKITTVLLTMKSKGEKY